MRFQSLVEKAHSQEASDLHLQANRPPRIRRDGDLRILDVAEPVLSQKELEQILEDYLSEELKEELRNRFQVDFSCYVELSSGALRLRGNAHRQESGLGIVFRLISAQVPSFKAIQLEPAVQRLVRYPKGLILVTGPTGSGKSSTLAALIEHINQTQSRHILTIEDPIEFIYEPKRSHFTQREVGPHSRGFAAALKSALRSDPDVILVGEMRDLETIQLALTASETGHLVLSTLHTSEASQTVDRIVDVFPGEQQQMVRSQLAQVLVGVISQVLLPRKEGVGRVAAREILLGSHALRTLIREKKTHQIYNLLSAGLEQGMCPLEYSLANLVQRNEIEKQEAIKVVNNPDLFQSYLEKRLF